MKLKTSPMTLVMLAIFAVLVGIASQWPEDVRFMPFVLGVPAIALCLLQLLLDMRAAPASAEEERSIGDELRAAEAHVSHMTGREMHFEVAHDMVLPEEEKVSGEASARREKIIWLAFTGLLAGIILFGFPVTVPLFLIGFLYWITCLTLVRSVIYGIAATAVMMTIFEYILQNELHRGIVTSYLLEKISG